MSRNTHRCSQLQTFIRRKRSGVEGLFIHARARAIRCRQIYKLKMNRVCINFCIMYRERMQVEGDNGQGERQHVLRDRSPRLESGLATHTHTRAIPFRNKTKIKSSYSTCFYCPKYRSLVSIFIIIISLSLFLLSLSPLSLSVQPDHRTTILRFVRVYSSSI